MNIPKISNKVFEGILFEVYQWKQMMFDNSERMFEMIKRKPAVSIICMTDDKIMIFMQEQPNRLPYQSLIGGIIEEGETPLDAAKREMLEETGYTSDNIEIICETFGGSKIYFPEYVFFARNCKKISEPKLDSGEKGSIRFISYDEFIELCRDENFSVPFKLRFMMYEFFIDKFKKDEFRKKIFGY